MALFTERTVTIDRSQISRALAKAIAFKQCGKDEKAAQWAALLVDLLDCAGILSDDGKRALSDCEG